MWTSISGPSRQYSTSEKLAARARLHQNYSIGEVAWFPWVAKRLAIKEDDQVVDVGCGPGWFWAAAAEMLPTRINLTLVDTSEGMIAEATSRCNSIGPWHVEGRVADAQSLPLPDATFDAVVAMHMLYHVPDQATAIAEMHRVLKPGGVLAVTTNGTENLQQLYALTTVLGSEPVDPAATAFGFDVADRLMRRQFGNVSHEIHPSSLRVTDPEDVFMALTSYPPGDGADAATLSAFRTAIDTAFQQGNGVLEVTKQTALFLSRKT